MKIKDYKCKCGHDDFFFADKGNQKGIYCSYCGKWLKWADKDEQNLSMKQEPKIGHWIEKDGYDGDTYYDCSECGESWTTIEGTPWNNGMKFCPNCGAKMESEVTE